MLLQDVASAAIAHLVQLTRIVAQEEALMIQGLVRMGAVFIIAAFPVWQIAIVAQVMIVARVAAPRQEAVANEMV